MTLGNSPTQDTLNVRPRRSVLWILIFAGNIAACNAMSAAGGRFYAHVKHASQSIRNTSFLISVSKRASVSPMDM